MNSDKKVVLTCKWKGVDRLAASISSGLDSGHRKPTADERFAYMALKLRERLEPLLEAAEELSNHRGKGMRGVLRLALLQAKLQKELATWRYARTTNSN